jgi:hypothetical protein
MYAMGDMAVDPLGGHSGTGGTGRASLNAGIAADAEAMEAYRICAKCGVDRFTQRPVRGG